MRVGVGFSRRHLKACEGPSHLARVAEQRGVRVLEPVERLDAEQMAWLGMGLGSGLGLGLGLGLGSGLGLGPGSGLGLGLGSGLGLLRPG